ncbi:DUF1489 family protein [Aureimonas phyllosphaerae]|uniref:Lysophospholipase n=1 Tax=Aureimonas phyllosphaerae TaxID=1166078 RepID=A0A7W6BW48_9HYPH|nr:DUF1489 domain-containing protein [Aureimonas phyllosphaerae]MBB3934811.1 hypothetical protein [Aureimonas phyllosphaerae]MBB3957974.1 hypothetical protein [Aureimonas phyllosphaerae]SFF43624.1 hypothetical protein SAMN05216566_11349 [Aureimonas phyllosphaerae]
MPLHMIKLCVGVDSVEDLEAHVRTRLSAGPGAEQTHVTRVMPKRADEMVGAGSLFWVIKGQVQVRQPILRFDAIRTEDGIERCRIVLKSDFIRTWPLPKRPFQGWRYLTAEDAPADLGDAADLAELPSALRRELAELGLL